MALSATTNWEFRASATASMVNSGGFNTGNANFLTDLTTDTNTGNTSAPVCSSASYTFVAGDVGAWIYVKSGTNWTPGWYIIDSVAGGKATVNATIGSAVINSAGFFQESTVLGVATVGTPTGGTFGIDYSQQDTAKLAITDLVIDAVTNTNVTSALTPFNPAYVGNIIHTTAGSGFTVGWYEVVSVSVITATLDRSAGTLGSIGGTSKLGGSLSLNSTLDDDFFEAVIGGNTVFFKNGSYTLGESIATASSSPTTQNPVPIIGFNSLRGDNPSFGNSPTIACGALVINFGNYKLVQNIKFTGSGATLVTSGACAYKKCKFLNTSGTANRDAFTTSTHYVVVHDCEFISQNGDAVSDAFQGMTMRRCWIHDSNIGITHTNANGNYNDNIIAYCTTQAFNCDTGGDIFSNNTFYGRDAKIGTAIDIASTAAENKINGNIFSGFVDGILKATSEYKTNTGNYNNYYNNTTDVTLFTKGPNDTTSNPTFTSVTQITGTTATSGSNVLTQSGGDFSSVTDNIDFLHIISGATAGIYLITSHTSTTLTCNNNMGVGSNIVYFVPVGHNFAIGTNLKAGDSFSTNEETITYADVGAVQRQESSGGGNFGFFGG